MYLTLLRIIFHKYFWNSYLWLRVNVIRFCPEMVLAFVIRLVHVILEVIVNLWLEQVWEVILLDIVNIKYRIDQKWQTEFTFLALYIIFVFLKNEFFEITIWYNDFPDKMVCDKKHILGKVKRIFTL